LKVDLLSAVVREAFSQRRKLLRHSLGRWLEAKGASTAFDLQRRAEEVPVEEFVALTQALGEAGVGAGPSDQAAASQ
jgi:16S rRNA (adenine1518-N6/adenine1519-N6)-dimethyltransferase